MPGEWRAVPDAWEEPAPGLGAGFPPPGPGGSAAGARELGRGLRPLLQHEEQNGTPGPDTREQGREPSSQAWATRTEVSGPRGPGSSPFRFSCSRVCPRVVLSRKVATSPMWLLKCKLTKSDT